MIASRRCPSATRPVRPEARRRRGRGARGRRSSGATAPRSARRPSNRTSPAMPHTARPTGPGRALVQSQVSFAPPPREELTTRLPSGATRVSARSSTTSRRRRPVDVDEGAQVDVPRLQQPVPDRRHARTAARPPAPPSRPGSRAISARRAATSAALAPRADQHALAAGAVDRLRDELADPLEHGPALGLVARAVGRHALEQRPLVEVVADQLGHRRSTSPCRPRRRCRARSRGRRRRPPRRRGSRAPIGAAVRSTRSAQLDVEPQVERADRPRGRAAGRPRRPRRRGRPPRRAAGPAPSASRRCSNQAALVGPLDSSAPRVPGSCLGEHGAAQLLEDDGGIEQPRGPRQVGQHLVEQLRGWRRRRRRRRGSAGCPRAPASRRTRCARGRSPRSARAATPAGSARPPRAASPGRRAPAPRSARRPARSGASPYTSSRNASRARARCTSPASSSAHSCRLQQARHEVDREGLLRAADAERRGRAPPPTRPGAPRARPTPLGAEAA